MRGSHRRVAVLEWCISTIVLNGTERDDDVDFHSLLLPRTDQEYDVLKRVIALSQHDLVSFESPKEGKLARILNHCRRVNRGFTPRIGFTALWNPIRVAPKSFIGKGYTDQGTLGTGPSWKDQILTAEDQPLQTANGFFNDLLSLE
jgi:hypothetical protein